MFLLQHHVTRSSCVGRMNWNFRLFLYPNSFNLGIYVNVECCCFHFFRLVFLFLCVLTSKICDHLLRASQHLLALQKSWLKLRYVESNLYQDFCTGKQRWKRREERLLGRNHGWRLEAESTFLHSAGMNVSEILRISEKGKERKKKTEEKYYLTIF